MDEKQQHIGYEVHTLDNMIGRLVSSIFESTESTSMQSWIIRFLYEHPQEDVFQKDLEAYFHIARSTATGILQLMEKRGFIRREAVESDARLKRIILTEKGIGLQLTIMEHFDYLESIMQKDLSPEQLDTFFQVIAQIKHNINHSYNKP